MMQVVNWAFQPFVRAFSQIQDYVFPEPNDTKDNYFLSAAKLVCIYRSWYYLTSLDYLGLVFDAKIQSFIKIFVGPMIWFFISIIDYVFGISDLSLVNMESVFFEEIVNFELY